MTFSSLAASRSSVAASHCRRAPFSYQTARHRPPGTRAGYTVTPHSNSTTTRPSPRVAARASPRSRAPGLAARRDRGPPLAGLACRRAPARAGCGVFVGILDRGGAPAAMACLLFLASSQVKRAAQLLLSRWRRGNDKPPEKRKVGSSTLPLTTSLTS